MKILVIDDQRIFKFDAVHVTTMQEGIDQIYNQGPWDQVYLDHDLGMESEGSGTDLVNYLERKPDFKVGMFFIQSMNPVGAERMRVVLNGMGYTVARVTYNDLDEMLDYKAMEEQGRNPLLRGKRQ